MKKLILSSMLATSVMLYSGCANKVLPNDRVGSISDSYSGVVKAVEGVKIQGDGKWTSIIGMIAGGVLGNQIGDGAGQDLATMGGAVVGSMAGQEADIDNAQRITITFDSGKTITTVLPIDANNPNQYKAGDRVTVFITNGRVTEIR
jgi:outer membrane lipoprotein SlyB